MDANADQKRLHRSRRDRVLAGVCGGLGEYFGVDPVVVRLAFVAVALAGGASVVAYIILALVLPEASGDEPTPRAAHAPEVAGMVLLVLGAVLLAVNVGWFRWLDWQVVWPALLVALGLALVLRRPAA
jgi:phage shock protein C